MADSEKALAGQYPEASLVVAMALSIWQGNTAAAKMDFAVSSRLKAGRVKRNNG
jgi:hypothetical protein